MTASGAPAIADQKVYQALAKAFVAEGVDTAHVLMGDGNMYWATALAREHGVRLVHARHEHSAVAMADGYARKTGKVGVASTTCGPGFTQIITALTVAVRRGTPLVIFVGDTPTSDFYHVQQIDQRPLAEATGARFIALRSADRLMDDVRQAFYTAQYERCPVVLSVPMDLQAQTLDWIPEIVPSRELLPMRQRTSPDGHALGQALETIAQARRPIVIAGEGAVLSGALSAANAFAQKLGALVSTTLRAKGFFDENPWSLGTSGTFAGDLAREFYAEADLVVGVGASLTSYTTEQGYLFPNAKVIQIDEKPKGLWQGLRVADLHIRADATATLEALNAKLPDPAGEHGFRTAGIRERLSNNTFEARPFQIEPGTVDPREALMELDRTIPPDWDVVVGCAHFFNFVVTHMRGRLPQRWHICHDFGAIGQALPTAIGIAAYRGDGKVAMIEGDGTFLMHVQELEVLARQNIKMLSVIINDGAYSAETHKLAAASIDIREAVFGRPDMATLAKGFGLGGAHIGSLGAMKALLDDYERSPTSAVWDVHASANVISQQYRRIFWGEH
jgi:thiamine pyrophosphate-dependent acetolactate synthase large subunit-like protein